MKYAVLIYQGEKFERSWENASEDDRRQVYADHDAFVDMLEKRGANCHRLQPFDMPVT